jgi:hypothetical protein
MGGIIVKLVIKERRFSGVGKSWWFRETTGIHQSL